MNATATHTLTTAQLQSFGEQIAAKAAQHAIAQALQPTLAIGDMCARYGVAKSTIYEWAKTKKIPPLDARGLWSRAELDKWDAQAGRASG